MDWNEAKTALVRRLWDEGHSATEIGRRIGVSKNAVVGKVHRLDLPARASPIKREGSNGPSQSRKPAVPRLSEIMPLGIQTPVHTVILNQRHATAFSNPSVPKPNPVAAAVSTPIRNVSPSSKHCCWPIGEPGKPDFRFCEAPTLATKPYCEDHAQIAYRKLPANHNDKFMTYVE